MDAAGTYERMILASSGSMSPSPAAYIRTNNVVDQVMLLQSTPYSIALIDYRTGALMDLQVAAMVNSAGARVFCSPQSIQAAMPSSPLLSAGSVPPFLETATAVAWPMTFPM